MLPRALLIGLVLTAALARAEAPPAAPQLLLRWGEKELFPSTLFALREGALFPQFSTPNDLGDPFSPICIELVAPQDDCPVTVTLRPTALYDETTFQARLPRRGVTYRLAPTLRLAYD